MVDSEIDEVPMYSDTHPRLLNEPVDSKFQRRASRTPSVSISIPMTTMESYEKEKNLLGPQWSQRKTSGRFSPKFYNDLYGYGDSKGWARRLSAFLIRCVPKVMNPHTKLVQQWNKFFEICFLLSIFVDPLFFFLLSVQKENKCIAIDSTMAIVLTVLRSVNDFIYFLNMIFQFRLAYVAVGSGELVDHPKKIARQYLQTYFFIDLFVVLPLPQIIILFVLPKNLGSSGTNYAKNLLRSAVLIQYIPKLSKVLPMLISPTRFFINIITFMLSGQCVGSCWYLFGLQRVNQCLFDACMKYDIPDCHKLIDCGHGNAEEYHNDINWVHWKNDTISNACFTEDGFAYGIYLKAVNLTTEHNVIIRYVYSGFWGFQQISTLAGNLNPSYFVWEVLFSMSIVIFGLFLVQILVQSFLHGLGRRSLEMLNRERDVEQWMRHRSLAEDLKWRVRLAERYRWSTHEDVRLENLPEDLQRDIRLHLIKRHFITFVKKIRIFGLMDELILDEICERLRQKTYSKGGRVLRNGGQVGEMIFVVHGKLESADENGIVLIFEGDVCGEELLAWCLEHSSEDDGKVRIPRQRLVSNKTVTCLSIVDALSLGAADLREVISLYPEFFQSPRVQAAIRFESPYWRSLAATRIQVAWRHRMKRLGRAELH